MKSGTKMRGWRMKWGGNPQIISHTPGELPECVSDKAELFIH